MIKGRFLSSQFVDANFYQQLMLASILHVFVCITLGVGAQCLSASTNTSWVHRYMFFWWQCQRPILLALKRLRGICTFVCLFPDSTDAQYLSASVFSSMHFIVYHILWFGLADTWCWTMLVCSSNNHWTSKNYASNNDFEGPFWENHSVSFVFSFT